MLVWQWVPIRPQVCKTETSPNSVVAPSMQLNRTILASERRDADRYPASPDMPKVMDEADLVRIDRSTAVTRSPNIWSSWFEGTRVSTDFMLDRDQPDSQ